MEEKIYKIMRGAGALNIVLGVISLVVGIAAGVLLIISGGKLMTYRLMAEWATDMVCKKLNHDGGPCTTATDPLPGSEDNTGEERRISSKKHIIELSTEQKAIFRL